MKLLNADKLIDFIKANKQINGYTGIPTELLDQLLSFISTNSIEVDRYNPRELFGYNTSDGKNFVTNFPIPSKNIDALYIVKKDKAESERCECDFCQESRGKPIAERIHQDIKAEQAYMEQPDVKTTDKSCDNCGNHTESDDEDYPYCIYYCRKDKVCPNWTPIKADKVERGENK